VTVPFLFCRKRFQAPASGPHYDGLLPQWGRGEYFPLAFTRARVEQVTRHRLRLKPA
jgi:hypothetical protein